MSDRLFSAPHPYSIPLIDRDEAISANVTAAHFAQFRQTGFAVVESMLSSEMVGRLVRRFEPLFRGEFDTGVYPDEWYWREGMSRDDVTRHMGNVWKSDTTVGSLSLSETVGRLAATLMGWDGARLGTDTLWWKPPGTSEVALHQDDTYGSFLEPAETATCWFTLDDTRADAGTIEYVAGSHLWPLKPDIGDFFAPADYRAAMHRAAETAGAKDVDIVRIVVPAGSCVIHSGRVWHGSDRNRSVNRPRRAIGVHLLHPDVRFKSGGGGYIYGRYKRHGDTSLDESFFPTLWRSDGARTAHLNERPLDAFDPRSWPTPSAEEVQS